MKTTHLLCVLLVGQFLAFQLYAQTHHLTNHFGQEHGLPSNHIYDICEDHDGFLWIATANGLSRFDGKKFFNYSTRHGLPSNDVLQVGVDRSGTIWVNCYKQVPSYFDRRLNKFIIIKNKAVDQISNQLFYISFDNEGRVLFRGNFDLVLFDFNKIPIVESIMESYRFKQDNRNYRFKNTIVDREKPKVEIEILDENKRTLTNRVFNYKFKTVYWGALTNHLDVFMDQRVYYRMRYNDKNKQLDILDSIVLPDTIKVFNMKNDVLSFIALNGDIHLYHNKNLKYIRTLRTNINANISYCDKRGNYWVGSMDRGLYLHTKSKIINPILPEQFNINLFSVDVEKDKIMLGNYQGQQISGFVENDEFKVVNKQFFDKPIWIRAVLFFDQKEFLVSDNIVAHQNSRISPISQTNHTPISLKTALKLNNANILIGTISGLLIFDINTYEYRFLNTPEERILSMAKIDDHAFYFVASKGIYKYDLTLNKAHLVFDNTKIINERIDKIEVNKFGQLCFSSYVGKIYFLNEKYQIRAVYGEEIGLPENLKELKDADGKVLWIASNKGVYGVDYQDLSRPEVTRYSLSDGLLSNEVNAIEYINNKLYVATNEGLSIIPLTKKSKRWPIFPRVVSIRIDGQDVPIQTKYRLDPTETMVNIQFSGVELYGHFSKFQYSIESGIWDDMDGTVLNLQLRPGKNVVRVRPIDDCNRIGDYTLALEFEVQIPFYNQTWFKILLGNVFIFVFFFLRYRYKLEQQRIDFEKQMILRKQREKITADLHDEIGSTLSSLQINSAVSKKLITTDVEKSKSLLKTIEKQAKDLSEKIGDIIWSLKPEDEFMSLSTRIKNFCSELISPTDIEYEIHIDKLVDGKLTDLTMRKNVLLICKEGLNNAVKYSNAEKITLTLRLDESHLLITIQDNGVGFEIDQKKGNGLSNMKRRTEELNGKLYIDSKMGKGTSISIEIPLS